MSDNYSIDENKRKQGNFQHKLFKFIILVIVAVFLYLIFSFVRIEFFKSSDVDYKLEMNTDKYNYLDKQDNFFTYSFDNKNIDECNLNNFYSEHIIDHKPCILKNKNEELQNYILKIKKIIKEEKLDNFSKFKKDENVLNMQGLINKIGIMNFAEIMDFNSLYLRYESKDSEKKINTKAINKNKEYIFIQMEGEREFSISPITQINKFKIKKANNNDNNINYFNEIEATNDLFSHEVKNTIILKASLNEGDLLYVPAYFFIQEKHLKGDEVSLKFEFNSTSRILETMFKILFDDNIKLDKD